MATKPPQVIERTYLFRGSDIIVPLTQRDLKADDPKAGLKRQIIATSEGVWNGDLFSADEIAKSVQDAVQQKETLGMSTYFPIPLVLDHDDKFLNKVGSTYDLSFQEEVQLRNKNVKNCAVASVEFWTGTPMLDEVAARVLKDPENTNFSVRIRGMLNYDPDKDQYYWTNFRIVHIAPVLEPADPDAQMIGELAKKRAAAAVSADFSLSANTPDAGTMAPPTTEDLQKQLASLQEKYDNLSREVEQSKTADAAKKATDAAAATAADLEAKAMLLAEIFALDKEVDKAFVKTLSKEQLASYKTDLERRVTLGTSEKGKNLGAGGSGGGQPTAEDYARQLLGIAPEKRA
jgi:hypothetical protein